MRREILTLLAALCCASFANAQTLLQYDTASSTSNATLAASTVNASLAADLMAQGGGLTANNGSTWNWREWAEGGVADTSYADAVADGDFWTWGFDVTDAVTVDMSALDIRVDRSGTGPNQFEIQASVNGGTGVSVLTHNFGDSGSGVDFIGVDLTTIGQLVQGDSVVFTLAAFGADSGGASAAGTFDLETVDFNGADERSVRIYGSISAIPEPSALLYVGGLGVALLVRRRA